MSATRAQAQSNGASEQPKATSATLQEKSGGADKESREDEEMEELEESDELSEYYDRVFVPLDPNGETTIVDWRKLATQDEEEDGEEDPTAMDIDVPAGPQSSMNDVIRNIEAKYSGRTGRELGYGDDGFVDDSDVIETRADDKQTTLGGFFVNSGDIETQRRPVEAGEVTPSSFKRYQSSYSGPRLHPEVEKAFLDFEEAIDRGSWGDMKRFPRELEPFLAKVADAAMKSHERGWITAEVVSRVASLVPFSETTLKVKMKQLVGSDSDESATQKPDPAATEAASSNPELIALQSNIEGKIAELKERLSRKIDTAYQAWKQNPLANVNDVRATAENQLQPRLTNFMQNSDNKIKPMLRWDNDIKILLLEINELTRQAAALKQKLGISPDKTVDGSERWEVNRLYNRIISWFPPEFEMKTTKISAAIAGYKQQEKKKEAKLAAAGTNASSNMPPPSPVLHGASDASSTIPTATTSAQGLISAPRVAAEPVAVLEPPKSIVASIFEPNSTPEKVVPASPTPEKKTRSSGRGKKSSTPASEPATPTSPTESSPVDTPDESPLPNKRKRKAKTPGPVEDDTPAPKSPPAKATGRGKRQKKKDETAEEPETPVKPEEPAADPNEIITGTVLTTVTHGVLKQIGMADKGTVGQPLQLPRSTVAELADMVKNILFPGFK